MGKLFKPGYVKGGHVSCVCICHSVVAYGIQILHCLNFGLDFLLSFCPPFFSPGMTENIDVPYPGGHEMNKN